MIAIGSYLDIFLIMALGLALAPFLGRYIANVYRGGPSWADPILFPLERGLYRLLGVDPREGMTWRQYAKALILTDGLAIVAIFVLLQFQGSLAYNALNAPSMTQDLAFHAAAAFGTNTDYQHYAGEAQISLLSSLFGLQTLMFLSPATGLCVFAAFARAFGRRDGKVGNYYADVVRT
ncbi:MAG: potassium-transporting ATPase subunit KdpA, partial [Thermoplasmata archaeon]|nr:potassium-transporting ATPase subunit KdpA [Thermoplasmata archaeon]